MGKGMYVFVFVQLFFCLAFVFGPQHNNNNIIIIIIIIVMVIVIIITFFFHTLIS